MFFLIRVFSRESVALFVSVRTRNKFSFSVVHFNFPVLRKYLACFRSITDSNNLQVLHVEVLLRSFLHVIGSDGGNSLRVSVPVVGGKIVKFLRDDVLQQRTRLLE